VLKEISVHKEDEHDEKV